MSFKHPYDPLTKTTEDVYNGGVVKCKFGWRYTSEHSLAAIKQFPFVGVDIPGVTFLLIIAMDLIPSAVVVITMHGFW